MTDDLVKLLRDSTEDMANHAVVGMGLWDLHSNACLEAADRIEQLEAALREIISNNPIHGDTGSARIKDIVDAIIRSSTIARAALGETKDD